MSTRGDSMPTGGVTTGSAAAQAEVQALDRRGIAVLSLGHLCIDLNQGAVPALLPFLVGRHDLSYTEASLLILAATVSSSVAQPLFGYLSDRRSWAPLLPLGALTGGAGIAVTGLAPDYPTVLFAVLASGAGVAAFHPEAARYAHYLSGSRAGAGMSLFQVGGNAGWALGPLLVTPAVLVLGLPGTLVVAIPAALATVLLAAELKRLEGFRVRGAARAIPSPDRWAPFVRLNVAIMFRSFVYFGLLTFVPLYFVRDLDSSEATGNLALALVLASGAVGNLVGGYLADRVGHRRVLVGSMALLSPLVGLFLLTGDNVIGFACLGLAGGCTVATFGVVVVMGQSYLPARVGVAAGFTVGLSIGLGGLAAPALGAIADAHGLFTTMVLVAVLPVGGALFALTLPEVEPSRVARRLARGCASAQAPPPT